MRAIFGKLIEGQKREKASDAGHLHFYELAVMNDKGNALRLGVDGNMPLSALEGFKTGDIVELELELWPRRCKGIRKDQSLYDTTLFQPSVLALVAA